MSLKQLIKLGVWMVISTAFGYYIAVTFEDPIKTTILCVLALVSFLVGTIIAEEE